jgi:hypothetical protein
MFIDSQEILSSSDFIERYCFMLCVRFTTPMSNCITGEKINVKVHKQPLKKNIFGYETFTGQCEQEIHRRRHKSCYDYA